MTATVNIIADSNAHSDAKNINSEFLRVGRTTAHVCPHTAHFTAPDISESVLYSVLQKSHFIFMILLIPQIILNSTNDIFHERVFVFRVSRS